MFTLPKPYRRDIHIPISWLQCFDDPVISVLDSAVTPDHFLLIAGFAVLPTVIEGDPSEERAHGTILKVSLSRSSSLKVYQPGMDNMLIGIDVNTSGEALVCGFVTMPFLVGGFGWILKLDVSGTPLWERRVGESVADRTMFFERIVATNDGGAAASGFFDEGQTRDRFFAKFDADGNIEFTRAIRGLPNAEDLLIAATPGGDLVICFERRPFLGPGVVACRFDSSGTIQWQREMPDLLNARSLSPLPDGSVLIGGTVGQIGSTPAGPVVFKLDPSGSVADVKRVGAQNEAGNPLVFRILHVAVTADEGILVLAATTGQSMLVGRFDSAGQALWGRTIDIDENFSSSAFVGAEVELAQASTYFLTLGNANNPERDIRVPVARLDEHGDIGLNGCGLLAPVVLQLTSDTLQIQDSVLTVETLTPPVTAVSSTVTEPDIFSRTVCLQERHVKFDPPFVDPPLRICFDDLPMPGIDPFPVPPGPEPGPQPPTPRPTGRSRFGSLLPSLACNSDPGCLRCLVRPEDGTRLPNPAWRAELYRALRPFTTLPEGRVPVEAAEVLRSALAKLPSGELLTSEVQSELRERITRWKKTREKKGNSYVPRGVALYPHLALAANLLDLDMLVPRPQLEQVTDGLAVKGLLKLQQDPRALSGATVRLASDAPGPLLPGMMAGWPALLWQVQLRDDALAYGIELSYRGCRFSTPGAALRLCQWRGRKLRDITTAVDQRNCVVMGRASGSGTFAILEQLPRS